MPATTPTTLATGQPIQIPTTEAGVRESLKPEAGGQLQFTFDPGSASFERVDNSLVITRDGGGTVVLEDYFAVGEQALPDFVLPDGTTVAAVDFLQAQAGGMDITTAAGPAATAAAPGSGGTNYDDGAGDLLNGVDRLGSLGTDYWGRSTEFTEDDAGVEAPGVSFSISIDTDVPPPVETEDDRVTGTFTNVLFEDSRPNQHLDGQAGDPTPGILQITLSPTGTTTVSALDLGGFTVGTRIEIEGGRVIEITAADQIITLSPTEITGKILIFAPENDSDADMNITYTLRYATAGGVAGSTSGGFTLVVDAVADKPTEEGSDIHLRQQRHVEGEYTAVELEDGTRQITTGELHQVKLDVQAFFSDTVDGSEQHSLEVRGVPADWQLRTDRGVGKNYEYTEVLSADGMTKTYIFAIPDNDTEEGFYLDSSVLFTTGDWTNDRLSTGEEHDSGPATISIVAVADEVNTLGGEATEVNNHAESVCGNYEISVIEDTPDFKGQGLRIISDETKGVQKHTDEISLKAFYHDAELQEILSGLGAPEGRPVSVAEDAFRYDLHSDGENDGGGNAGQAFLGFVASDEAPEGGSSGWTTTSGEEIFLHYENGSVIGTTASGTIAFIAVPEGSLSNGAHSGTVTFVQYTALQHPTDGTSHNEKLADLNLTLQLTDDDGDSTTLPVTLNVRDDGPKLVCNELWVNLAETDLPGGSDQWHMKDNVDGNLHDESLFIGFIGFSYGTDGPAAATPFSWDVEELGTAGYLTYDAVGNPVAVVWDLSADGLTVIGYAEGGSIDTPALILKATLTPNGATYVVNQEAPLFHDQPTNDTHVELNVPFTITDGDGDTSKGGLTISILDDVPCAGKCAINDMVFEKDLREDGVITTSGDLTSFFGADGAHPETPLFWDVAAITEEASFYKAMIDGQPVDLTVAFYEGDHPYVGEFPTTFMFMAGDVPVAKGTLVYDPATGKCSYEYEQYTAIEHGPSGSVSDIGRKLDLQYVVMDADGDTAKNDLDIYVVDSVALPGGGYGHFDETDARAGFPLTGTIDLKLDYAAPDGIAAVAWNKPLIDKALNTYNDAAPAEADGFTCEVNGRLLTISQFGKAVLELTLTPNPDGTYSVAYNQIAPLDHPLGAQVLGLSHDEPLPFLLPIDVTDGDGDTTLSLVTVVVDDDGPDASVGSNVAFLQVVGDAILRGLDDLDISNPQAFLESLGKNFMDGLGAGLGDTKTIFDLADLVLNTNLGNNAPGELPFVGKDSDRTEKVGQVYEAQLQNLQFGADGPAETDAVAWSKTGVTALLKLIGLHATGHGGEELTVEGSGQHLLVKSGGVELLQLDIDNDGKATITQLAPLGHNSSSLTGLLAGAVEGLTANVELLQSLAAMGIDPAQLIQALDGGNTLALPLPVVITDHDGDSAPGIIGVIIRDSVPVNADAIHAYVGESDLLPGGRDALHGQENVAQNPNGDEGSYSGKLTVDFGYDGAHATTPFQWDKPADWLYTTADGGKITWEYAQDDPTSLVGYDADHNPVITISGVLSGSTVDYVVTLHQALQHPHGADENSLDLSVAFTITDGDGDSVSSTLTVHVKDDIPVAVTNYDALDAPANLGGVWTATGNILTGENTTVADGAEQAAADIFGADGRLADGTDASGAAVGGLQVQDADGNWHIVTPDAPLTLAGTYGDLVINNDGSYTYTVDAERMQDALDNAAPVVKDIQVNLTGTSPSFQGLDITAFTTGSKDGATPAGSPSTWSSATLATTNDGLGVNSGILSHDDTVGGATTASSREGVLINFPDPVNKAEFSLAGLENKGAQQVISLPIVGEITLSYTLIEQVKLVFYNEAGEKIGEKIYAGDADGLVNVGLPDGVTGVAQVAIIGMPPLVTVNTTGVPSWLQSTAENMVKGLATGTDDGFTITGVATTKLVPATPTDLTESFDYKIIDKDGDESTAQLVINANAKPGGPIVVADGAAVVAEHDLSQGSDAAHAADNRGDGVNNDNESTFKGNFGKFDFGPEGPHGETPFTWNKPADGLFTDNEGNPVVWEVVDGGLGLVGTANGVTVITLTASGLTGDTPSYEVVLSQPINHIGENADNLEQLGFDLSFTIADRSGDEVNGNLTVSIIDDMPVAVADWVGVPSGVSTLYGNVIEGMWGTQADALDKSAAETAGGSAADAMGADGASVCRVRLHVDNPEHQGDGEWVELNKGEDTDPHGKYADVPGENGTLRIYADGTYIFSPEIVYTEVFGGGAGFPGNSNSWGQQGIYKDYSYSVIRVTTAGTDLDDLVYPTKNADGKFDISGQGQGAGMGIKGGAGLGSEIDHADSNYNEGVLITPPSDNLTAMKLTFAGLDGNEVVKWVAYDTDGSVLASGETTQSELTITSSSPIGNVLVYAGDDNTGFRIQTISAGQMGTAGEQCFDYELKDADGDISMTQLHFHGVAQLNLAGATSVIVDEANFASGTAPDADSLTQTGVIDIDNQGRDFTLVINEGASSITLTKAQLENGDYGTAINDLENGDIKGSLKVTGYDSSTGKVSYEYTLTDTWTHTKAGQQGQEDTFDSTFQVSVTDVGGYVSTGNLTVTILDDGPIAKADVALLQASDSSISGNVLTGLLADGSTRTGIADSFGADDAAADKIDWVNAAGNVSIYFGTTQLSRNTVTGELTANSKSYGFLTLDEATGAYTFTKPTGGMSTGDIKVAYTIEDADGDRSSSTLTINVAGEPPVITPGDASGCDTLVYEGHLPSGSHSGVNDGHGVTASVKYTVDLKGAELTSFTINGATFTVAADGTLNGNFASITVNNGNVTGGTFDGTTLTLAYKLTSNYNGHSGPGGEETPDIALDRVGIDVVVHSTSGDSAQAAGKVGIVDDAPLAAHDLNILENTGSVWVASGNVLTSAGSDYTAANTGGAPAWVQNDTPAHTDSFGADTPASQTLVGFKYTDANGVQQTVTFTNNNPVTVTVQGGGQLTMYNNGNYEYSAAYVAPSSTTVTHNVNMIFGSTLSTQVDGAVESGKAYSFTALKSIPTGGNSNTGTIADNLDLATVLGSAKANLVYNNSNRAIGVSSGRTGDVVNSIGGSRSEGEAVLISTTDIYTHGLQTMKITLGDYGTNELARVAVFDVNGNRLDSSDYTLTESGGVINISMTNTAAPYESIGHVLVVADRGTNSGTTEFTIKGVTGTYDTLQHSEDSSPLTEITYTIKDSEGDTSSAILRLEHPDPSFVVGSNYDDKGGSTHDYTVTDSDPRTEDHGIIYGGTESDVLVGDATGVNITGTEVKNYNICIVLDTSGSMADSTSTVKPGGGYYTRMELAKMSLEKMLHDLSEYEGNINLKLVTFQTSASGAYSPVIELNNGNYEQALNALIASINSLKASGGTNYEGAFAEAAKWFNGTGTGFAGNALYKDYENKVLFLTDGKPTTTTTNQDGDGSTMSNNDFNYGYSEFQKLINNGMGIEVSGIGIGTGIDESVLKFFDNTTSSGFLSVATGTSSDGTNISVSGIAGKIYGEVQIVNKAADLDAALAKGLSITRVNAGNDVIMGGAGNDVIFGDILNTDVLARNRGVNLPAGSGWYVFAALEADAAFGWSREDTLRYIQEHQQELSVELGSSSNSGNDVLIGGSGNDAVHGQDGNDLIVGGDLHFNGLHGEAAFNALIAAAGSSSTQNVIDYLKGHIDQIGQGTVADGNDSLYGGTGNDLLIGGGGNDILNGDAGDDILFGGAGNDMLYGGSGNDILYGGAGDDVMYGGAGADTFAWLEGDLGGGSIDKVMDFSMTEGDKLNFDDLLDANDPMDSVLNHIERMDMSEDKLTLHTETNDIIELNMGSDANYQQIYNSWSSGSDTLKAELQEQLLKLIIENS